MQTKPPEPLTGKRRTDAPQQSLNQAQFLQSTDDLRARLAFLNEIDPNFFVGFGNALKHADGEMVTEEGGFQILLRRRCIAQEMQKHEGLLAILDFSLHEKPKHVAKLLEQLLVFLAVGGLQPVQGRRDRELHTASKTSDGSEVPA